MSHMHAFHPHPVVRQIQHALPPMLQAAGVERTPRQEAGGCVAGCDPEVSGESWPGCSVGVRAPGVGETPLSFHEVAHAVREGLL